MDESQKHVEQIETKHTVWVHEYKVEEEAQLSQDTDCFEEKGEGNDGLMGAGRGLCKVTAMFYFFT